MLSCFPVDFSIPIEILFVVFADGAQYTARVSYRHYVSAMMDSSVGIVDLLAVDRIFYRHGSTPLIYKESFSFFSRFFQILSVLCRTDTILFLEYPAKIEWVLIPYDLCNFSNIVFGVLQ